VLVKALREMSSRGVMSAKRLLELAKGLSALIQGTTSSSIDLHKAIVDALRARNRLLKVPLIVADSNWVRDYFAFVVNPATSNLELWSVDFYGVTGKQITSWKNWLNGSTRSPQWGIFSKPFEYVARN
jgi:hypothetical protein